MRSCRTGKWLYSATGDGNSWEARAGTLTIGVVHPNQEPKALRFDLQAAKVGPAAPLWQIAGDDPAARNSVENQAVAIDGPNEFGFDGTLTVPDYGASAIAARTGWTLP